MAKGLYKALNIESGEETSVLLLILQSIFLGTFYGTFDISAHALFLGVFEPAMIPKAYIVSGFAGIIMTTIWSWLQSKMKFSTFVRFNLILVAIITILMRAGFIFTDSNWHIFLVFVMMGPLNIIALLGFWGTVGRIFSLRQGKRLFGLIDTGQILGIIVSSYAVPLLLSLHFKTRDLLLISSASIFIALIVQMILSGKITLERKPESKDTPVVENPSFFSLFKSRYITSMSLFVVFLVVVTFFVHFSFLAVSNEKYPLQDDLAAFLGYFTGTLMIFSMLIKTFVYGRLMKTYGLKVALMISPLLILLFTVIAAIIGGFFGYTAAAASFTLFFLVISVNKLFAKSLQDSMVAPSLKILYQSLDIRIRYNVQARVDGTINEISALSSGLILTGLGALAFIHLIHYTYVLIFVLVVWAFVSIRLYREYQRSLNESLAKFKQTETETGIRRTTEIIRNEYGKGSEIHILNGLMISELIDLKSFKESVINFLGNTGKLVQNFIISKVKELEIKESVKEIEKQSKLAPETRDVLKPLLDYLNAPVKGEIAEEKLSNLLKSANPGDRKKLAKFLRDTEKFSHLPLLNTLLRDNDPGVRIAAIQAASHHRVNETVPVLVDLLATPVYRYAADALLNIGGEAVESLENAFYRTGIDDQTLIRITRIMGQIVTPEAENYVVNKINHNDRRIALQALESLRERGYQADEKNIHKILQALRSVAGLLSWNLAAQYTIKEKNVGPYLEKAINEEISSDFDQLYLLLSVAYDPKSIHHIRENLETGTREGIGFAIELLDIFIAEELKPLLFPILEDTSPLEKIRQLQVEFPVEVMQPYELVINLINRDPNYVNPYTKACAILTLDHLENVTVTNDLIAQVFNPDVLLSQLAAWKIYRLDPDLYYSVSERLDQERKEQLNNQIKLIENNNLYLIINKVFFLERIRYYKHLPGSELISLAKVLQQQKLKENQILELNDTGEKNNVAFIASGNLDLLRNGTEIADLTMNDIAWGMPLLVNKTDKFALKARSEATILETSQEFFNEIMFDCDRFALAVYHCMNEQTSKYADIIKERINLVS